MRASYLQIYMENINDLLRPDRVNLNIREDKKKGFFVDGLSEWVVRTPKDIYALIKRGTNSRATAYTKANDISSRSHAVFIIFVEQLKILDEASEASDGEPVKQMRYGKLNLVDLAGSERLKITGATGQRLEECKKINQSLSCLGNVISVLVENKNGNHIPYRDSKLTRLLEDSLGGNCKTTMMGMISPAYEAFGESLSTLKFANRAKKIRNRPKINEDVDSKAMLVRYEKEITQLRMELETRNKHLVDAGKLLQLEEEKQRLEEDRVAAIQALEQQSRDFLQEREEKKRLEAMIRQIEGNLHFGVRATNSDGQPKESYDKRFKELERERQQLEEDRAQVDQYKQLLLKQRDIMIALTTRLNERDETIVQLQEELDAYDRIHYEAEEMLEIKRTHIEQLEEQLRKHGISIPSVEYTSKEKHRNGSSMGHTMSHSPKKTGISEGEEYRKTIDDQKEMILKLQRELRGLRDKDPSSSGLESQLQTEYNDKLTKLTKKHQKEVKDLNDKLKISEDNVKQLTELLQNTSRPNESRSGIEGGVISMIKGSFMLIIEKVDNVVSTLSQQNDSQKLHSVAHELLSLQKALRDLSQTSQNYTSNSSKRSVNEDYSGRENVYISKDSGLSTSSHVSRALKDHQTQNGGKKLPSFSGPQQPQPGTGGGFSLSKYQRNNMAHD